MLTNEPFYYPGQGPHAFLLLHGLGGGIYELQPVGERLHQMGFSVSGFNYPGHDFPSERMPYSHWEQWHERIVEQYEKLRENHDTISIVAFSTGCPLALKLIQSHPADRLILLSPFLNIKHEWYYGMTPEFYVRNLATLIPDVPRRRLAIQDPIMLKHAEAACFFKSFNIRAVQSALELIEQVKPTLPEVTADTLIIQSHRDSIVQPDGAAYLMQNLGSANKSIHWLERSNHVVTLDIERHTVMDKITDFLLPIAV